MLTFQVIEDSDYLCVIDSVHTTFSSASTGWNFVEGHHIIPLGRQDKFQYSLDVYANIVNLCPICHRQLHFGRSCDKARLLRQLLDKRNQRLIKSVVSVSLDNLVILLECHAP